MFFAELSLNVSPPTLEVECCGAIESKPKGTGQHVPLGDWKCGIWLQDSPPVIVVRGQLYNQWVDKPTGWNRESMIEKWKWLKSQDRDQKQGL